MPPLLNKEKKMAKKITEKATKQKEEIIPRLGDDIPESWTKQAISEIKGKYKTVTLDDFRDEKDVIIHLYRLSIKEESLASDHFARAYSRLIKDPDLMTKKEMSKLLEERGIWGKPEEEMIESIRDEMNAIEVGVGKLREKKKFTEEKRKEFRGEWIKRRQQISDLIRERDNILAHTVEGRAEEEEVGMKVSLCAKYPNGEYVWPTYEEFIDETDKQGLGLIVRESMLFWVGLSQEIIQDLPADLLFGREVSESENSQEK